MRFQPVKYQDSDFPNTNRVGVFDTETGELYPFESGENVKLVSDNLNSGMYQPILIIPFPSSFMSSVGNIQPL